MNASGITIAHYEVSEEGQSPSLAPLPARAPTPDRKGCDSARVHLEGKEARGRRGGREGGGLRWEGAAPPRSPPMGRAPLGCPQGVGVAGGGEPPKKIESAPGRGGDAAAGARSCPSAPPAAAAQSRQLRSPSWGGEWPASAPRTAPVLAAEGRGAGRRGAPAVPFLRLPAPPPAPPARSGPPFPALPPAPGPRQALAGLPQHLRAFLQLAPALPPLPSPSGVRQKHAQGARLPARAGAPTSASPGTASLGEGRTTGLAPFRGRAGVPRLGTAVALPGEGGAGFAAVEAPDAEARAGAGAEKLRLPRRFFAKLLVEPAATHPAEGNLPSLVARGGGPLKTRRGTSRPTGIAAGSGGGAYFPFPELLCHLWVHEHFCP